MKERKSIFFTSDLHLDHENVIQFDNRPFKDVNHMNETIINNINNTVRDGLLYILGDFGMTNAERMKQIVSRITGTKVLILGNHDKNTYSMYNAGFDVVLNSAIIYIGKHRVSMSHCPLPGIFREDVTNMKGAKPGEMWHGEYKNQMFTSQDMTVDFHLSGHIHSNPYNNTPKFTDRQYDVGVSANNFKPVSISQIESWIANVLKKKNENKTFKD